MDEVGDSAVVEGNILVDILVSGPALASTMLDEDDEDAVVLGVLMRETIVQTANRKQREVRL